MIDLHLHLDGSLNPEYVKKMAQMSGMELEYSEEELRKMLMVSSDCTSLGEYLEKFELPLRLLQTAECVEYAVYELMRDLEQQGLCYAEIRFAPQLHGQNQLSQEEVVQAALRGLRRGNQEFPLSANLILCCMRGDDNVLENMETVSVAAKYLRKGVCAVDLAGNEAAYPTRQFEEIFQAAKEKGIPIIIHAGEAAGAESIRQAISMGAVRIGHGIRAVEDTELMEMLKEKQIYLEMCYSSNLQTKTVENVNDYPIREFLEKGIGITLNTDNVTVSNTALKKEYQLVKEQFCLDETVLLKVALNAVQAAFVSEEEKKQLKERIIRDFSGWLSSGTDFTGDSVLCE